MPLFRRFLSFTAALLSLLPLSAQKWEGLAPTPPMGWNSWNCFRWEINEEQIREIADCMVSLGLVDAGYTYLNLDDAWHGQRDSLGFIHESPERFPSGMKALADYVHARGMKFGLYSDAGDKTCACFAGSLGHEYQDARVYASWGVDYLKYDFCYTEGVNGRGAYRLMRDALRWAGRPVVFSICEGGYQRPWEWGADVAHLWRTTVDIGPVFAYPGGKNEVGQLGFVSILDLNEGLRAYAGPDHWNDPDMLEVGNGMTQAEDRAHFSLWCMMAAPLLLGNDLRSIRPETLAILTNRAVIAVDQDPLGVQGLRLRTDQQGVEYWLKPLSGGDWAVCLFNRSEEEIALTLEWNSLQFTDPLSGQTLDIEKHVYWVQDLWAGTEKAFPTARRVRRGLQSRSLDLRIPSHDVVMYRLKYEN